MQETEFDIRAVIGVLRRQWRVIVYTVIGALGVTGLWLLTLTPLYTASALMLLDPGQTNLLDTQERSTSPAADNSRVASAVEIIRSDATILSVVRNADLVGSEEFGTRTSATGQLMATLGFARTSTENPDVLLQRMVNRFRSALNVNRQGLTYLVRVSVTSEDRNQAARLANMTAQTYIDNQIAAKVGAALTARDVIRARLTEADAELIAAEQAFDSFIDENLARLSAQSGDTALEGLRDSLRALEAEAQATRVQSSQAAASLQDQDWSALATSLQDDILRDLDAQRRALEDQVAEAAEGNPVNLRAELAAVERRLAERSSGLVDELRTDLAQIEAREAGFEEELRGAVLGAELPPELLSQVFSIQQRGTLARSQYQTLLSRLRDFETQADLQVADARIVSAALAPAGPSFPDRRLSMALALFGGLGLGIGLAFLREFYVGGFTSEKQIADILGLRVPAAMPRLEKAEGDSPAHSIVTAPLSHYAESVRRLRASIDQTLARAGHEGARTIMIASSLPAEGKTTTSLSLARTYALSGVRTLLIDCDLRKPSIAGTLGLAAEKGLLDYLIAPAKTRPELRSIMALDSETDLEIIPSIGRSNRPTDQLLTSAAFADLIAAVRQHYDMIILDTPPVLPVVDARYLAGHADAIAVVVKWADTRQQDMRQTVSILDESRQDGVPIFAVLNQQAGRRARSYAKGYYGYGGGYIKE